MAEQRRQRRGHNEGSYYRTADGRWRAAITVHHDDGRVTRRYLSGRNKRDVMARAAELRRRQDQGIPEDSSQTVADYLDRWLRDAVDPSVGPNSRVAARTAIARVTPAIGRLQLRQVTPARLAALFAELARAYAPGTIVQTRSVLRRALGQAVRWELLSRNPIEGTTAPRVEAQTKRVLRPEEIRRLLDVAEERADPLAALWTLYALLGLRRGEGLGLRWADVDLGAGLLHVRVQYTRGRRDAPLKTRASARTLVLPDRARRALARLRESSAGGDNDLLFVRPDGSGYPESTAQNRFRRALALAGLPDVGPHTLRHTVASLLAEAGAAPRDVAALLGHASTTITLDLYTHVGPDAARTMAQRMGALVDEGADTETPP